MRLVPVTQPEPSPGEPEPPEPAPPAAKGKGVLGAGRVLPDWLGASEQELIRRGVNTEQEALALGDVVSARITDKYLEELRAARMLLMAAQTNRRRAFAEVDKLIALPRPTTTADQLADDAARMAAARRYGDAHKSVIDAEAELRGLYHGTTRAVLAEIRDSGGVDLHRVAGASGVDIDVAVAEKFKRDVQVYPTDWLRGVRGTAVTVLATGRGYFMGWSSQYRGSVVAINKDQFEADGVAIHEMGHLFEWYGGGALSRIAKEFYGRRTKGEPLKWMGPGYEKTEMTRIDKFVSSYIGKDYQTSIPGSPHTEVLSVGFESLLAAQTPVRLDLNADPEYYSLLLGLLAGVKR